MMAGKKRLFDKFLSTHFLGLHNQDPDQWRTDTYQQLFGRYLPRDQSAKILDIGCGMGQFLWFLRQRGYRNHLGVDISKEAVAFCRAKVTKNVRLIENLPNFLRGCRNQYQTIIMNDILEHFKKDEIAGILAGVRRCLKSQGSLIIKTPNAAALTSFYARHQDFTHELSFTEHSLRQILKIAGFSRIEIMGEENGNWLKICLHRLLMKALYRLERGGLVNPTIYSFNLIAVAKK